MPAGTAVAEVETRLRAQARKKKLKGRDAASYVYGTLNKAGLKHGNVTTDKGMRPAGSSVHAHAMRRAMRGGY